MDKWFHTGDLCRIDPDGFAYIVGRIKDMIKVRAWQVNPYEIEEAIKLNVAGVSECVVIAVDDETDGQRPKAFIVGQVDPNDVIEFVRGMGTYQSETK
uniref:AMP-binding domain-containing protein n=1 Tax=Angiostrongylus cantonensis TaxID=6313 RepID=A0A0K0D9K4_ANGCA